LHEELAASNWQDPLLQRANYFLAMSYQKVGENLKAEKMFKKIISTPGTGPEAAVWKSLSQKELDNLEFSNRYSRKIESELGKKSL